MAWIKGDVGQVEAPSYSAATFLNGTVLWSLVRKSLIVGAICGTLFGILGRIF